MKTSFFRKLLPLALTILFTTPHMTYGVETLGTGNASLLGGDITDPEDDVVDIGSWDGGSGEEAMKPQKSNWLKMKATPVAPPHQSHAYHSWQSQPPVAIFLNHPEQRKWYLGYKDGGQGGPTDTAPYSLAVQFKDSYLLTHFTLTTSPDSPERDPVKWAIQGSNTGNDKDWTDIYRNDGKDRATSNLPDARTTTQLFTCFDSRNMGMNISTADAQKINKKLAGKKIAKADFKKPMKSYTWFRIVVYACVNPNSMTYVDFNHPPGFAVGQLELFGNRSGGGGGAAGSPAAAGATAFTHVEQIRPAAYSPEFIISYWCGPPKSETTLERYKEIAECGFNVAYPAIDHLWQPGSKEADEHIKKYLDMCQQAGLKGFVWDGYIPKGEGWAKPTPSDIPQIERALDGMIAKVATHPAFMGFVLGDEMGIAQHARLGVVNQYLLKKDPKHLPYYNLLPLYAFPNREGEYQTMVQDYIDTVKPGLVSWDHYRQMFEGGDENTYWKNLQLMRDLCGKAKIPFNQIIVSLKHMGYRECSEVDLRWQVFTSLAYGSRGIQYFTYWDVKELAWAGAPALMTMDGKRDAKWEYAKKINHRIANLGKVLVKLTSTGVYAVEQLKPGLVGLSDTAPIKSAEGGPLLLGCFEDALKRQFVMVVNRSFQQKVTAKLTLAPKLITTVEISQETGTPMTSTPTGGQPVEVVLEPGEGRLFALLEYIKK